MYKHFLVFNEIHLDVTGRQVWKHPLISPIHVNSGQGTYFKVIFYLRAFSVNLINKEMILLKRAFMVELHNLD